MLAEETGELRESVSFHRTFSDSLGVVLYEMLTGELPTEGWDLNSKTVTAA